MKTHSTIYIIEDEADLGQLISRTLQKYNFQTRVFEGGLPALNAVQTEPPALCFVDLNLPDIDGIELVKQLKQHDVGLIIVSGRDELSDRILGLELGADDYVTKPFEPRELVARAQSVLRRLKVSTGEVSTSKAQFAGWRYLPESMQLIKSENGEEEALSRAEADMLLAFLKAPKQILSRDQLLGENTAPYDRSIDVRISRLRKKLGDNSDGTPLIKTVYGAGYMFLSEVSWG